jgi:hypothetical protein
MMFKMQKCVFDRRESGKVFKASMRRKRKENRPLERALKTAHSHLGYPTD